MPNHVHNIINLTGPVEDIKKLSELVYNKNYRYSDGEIEEKAFDFDRIIHMPKNIYRGGLGLEEKEKYGKNNWYDWSIANWGTKWNAYDISEPNISLKEKSGSYKISFNTAWSAPLPVYFELARLFPRIEGLIQYADEDMGYNCGEIKIEGGQLYQWTPEESGSDAALDFASQVWGEEY